MQDYLRKNRTVSAKNDIIGVEYTTKLQKFHWNDNKRESNITKSMSDN